MLQPGEALPAAYIAGTREDGKGKLLLAKARGLLQGQGHGPAGRCDSQCLTFLDGRRKRRELWRLLAPGVGVGSRGVVRCGQSLGQG